MYATPLMPTPYVPTFTGLRLNCFDPQTEQIHLIDIARGLSRTPRFAGQCRADYSVGQHALLVEQIAFRSLPAPRPEFLMGALLRCAHQAYMGGMVGPVKAAVDQLAPGALGQVIAKLSCAIERRFRLHLDMAEVVLINVAEREALRCERDDLGVDPDGCWPELHRTLRPMGIKRIEPLPADEVFQRFVNRAMAIMGDAL